MKLVMGSAAKAEIRAGFICAKDILLIQVCLEEIGHPRPPTPIHTDNSTVGGFANKTIKQHQSKAIGMQFY